MLDSNIKSTGEVKKCVTLPNLFLDSWQENKVMSGDVSVEQDIQANGLQKVSRRVGGAGAKVSQMPHALSIWKQL